MIIQVADGGVMSTSFGYLLFSILLNTCRRHVVHSLTYNDTGLLSDILFSFVLHACDGESPRLRCPRSTVINVRHAEYGRRSDQPSPCPPDSRWVRRSLDADDDTWRTAPNDGTTCLANDALSVVMDICESKQNCRVSVARQQFARGAIVDCLTSPTGAGNWLTVAYQCRPEEILSRSLCTGQTVQLTCPRDHYIAVHSATHVQLVGGQCSAGDSTQHVSTDDATSIAVRPPAQCDSDMIRFRRHCDSVAVAQRCHGLDTCVVTAHDDQSDDPTLTCRPSVALSVFRIFYVCAASRTVSQSASRWLDTEDIVCRSSTVSSAAHDVINDAVLSSIQVPVSQEHSSTPSPENTMKPKSRFTIGIIPVESENSNSKRSGVVQLFYECIWTFMFVKENGTRLPLYVTLAVLAGLILFLVATVIYLRFCRRLNARSSKSAQRPLSPSKSSTTATTTLVEGSAVDHQSAIIGVTSVDGPPSTLSTTPPPASVSDEDERMMLTTTSRFSPMEESYSGYGKGMGSVGGRLDAYTNPYRNDMMQYYERFQSLRTLPPPLRLRFDDE